MTDQTIFTATFNPRIKSYIFFVGALLLLISFIGMPILIIWILGLGQYFSRKYYNNLDCKVTTHHLEFKKGMFFKVEKTIPLENIQDLTFIQNPILNFFNLKILKIETAGNSSSTGADMKLVGIIDAEDFKKKVLQQREQFQTKKHGGSSTDSVLETNQLLREIRDLLQQKQL